MMSDCWCCLQLSLPTVASLCLEESIASSGISDGVSSQAALQEWTAEAASCVPEPAHHVSGGPPETWWAGCSHQSVRFVQTLVLSGWGLNSLVKFWHIIYCENQIKQLTGGGSWDQNQFDIACFEGLKMMKTGHVCGAEKRYNRSLKLTKSSDLFGPLNS